MKILYLYILLFNASMILADDDYSLIDETHKHISERVVLTSTYIDDTIDSFFDKNNQKEVIKKDIDKIDSFYKNDKFIDETNESFLRVRIESNYQKLKENSFDIKLRAYLNFSKTKQNIQLFIEDVNKDNYKELPFKNSNLSDSTMAIGISYFTLSYYDIDSKYSLGIRGLYPYVKVRYKKDFSYNQWLMEASQSFIYSSKTNFKEETKLYFDKRLDELNLFRVELARSTKSKQKGMDYLLALSYFYQPKKDTGISISQSFVGNTKFNYIDDNNLYIYSGINTYSTEISWRQSVFKKWFFYEIKPGVDFQKVYNYKINYKILFLTDFYF